MAATSAPKQNSITTRDTLISTVSTRGVLLGACGQVGFSWFVINHPGDPEWDRPPANLKNHGLWDDCDIF